jgi:hypothetical protein
MLSAIVSLIAVVELDDGHKGKAACDAAPSALDPDGGRASKTLECLFIPKVQLQDVANFRKSLQ